MLLSHFTRNNYSAFSRFAAVIVVFDMTDLYSLTSCPAWLEDALKVNSVRPIVFLVGTKRDLLVRRRALLVARFNEFSSADPVRID